MVEILGKYYYVDIDSITEKCKTGEIINEEDGTQGTEINIFKYEIIKMCLERILSEYDEVDPQMGAFASQELSVSFKLAFNTLLKNEILIEEE
jgi:hypothetical protein